MLNCGGSEASLSSGPRKTRRITARVCFDDPACVADLYCRSQSQIAKDARLDAIFASLRSDPYGERLDKLQGLWSESSESLDADWAELEAIAQVGILLRLL